MENQNKIVESILAKEKAKGATKPKDIKPTQGMSIAEKIDAKMQGSQQQPSDMAARIGANAEAMQGALAHRDYEKTKANTAKMLDESSLGTKPYASSEDVQREQVQTFMDKKAEEARARGMKDYLDSTIGTWSADRVSSIVGGLTDADAERIRRGAERVSQLKQEGETPEATELSIPRAKVDVQLPKSITEAKILIEQERTKGVNKISFHGLADRSKKEASKVVKDYLAENPHMESNAEMLEAYVANNIYNDTFKWKLENDEQFFADAYEATTGKSYAEYKREVDKEAREKLQSMKRELEAMNEVLKKKRDENRTNAGQSRSAFSAAWSDLKNAFGGNIEEIENLIDEIDNALEGSFSSGFDKGFDFDRMATMGLSGVFTEGEMANALMKANNGESLTEEEENYVRIHQYAQELDQLKKVREKYAEQMYDKFLGFNLNSIGEGVGTTVEMMPAFAGSMNATGMIGKFADIGTMTTLKTALKTGGKDLFKYGVKTTSKLGYNYGLAKVRGLAAAPFMPSTYNTYLESLNSAYSFDDNGNLTYKPVDKTQSYFGAVFSTANEISSEYLGIGIGKVVGWGARGVGRMAANTKIAETLVDAGKKVRKHLPKLTPQAKVAMRTLGVQADPISETLSEALGDIMTSYEQSMIGMDVDMNQYGTFDYWMTLAGVTLAYGGSIAAMGAVKSYADVRSAVKERDAILGKISNRNLYNTLLAVSTSDDVVLASSALADFDWDGNGIKPEDEERRLTEAYVAADLNVKIMEGAVEEGSRLDKFRGTIEGVRNIVYQGEAGEYSDKIFEAEVDGKKVFVVNGFENDSTTNLYVVVDAATGEKSSVDKSKVKLTRELDVDAYIQEAYTEAFSLEIEKERVKDVREKALQMDNPTEKDVQRVASTLDIALPKVGDAVMLAKGNMGSVTERLSPTEYAVQDLSGATYKVHFTDILSTDKLTATAQGAMARGEVSTPMSTTSEASAVETSAEDVIPNVAEPTVDENGITMGGEVTIDGRVGTVRARTENGDYVVAFEDESGNYENAEVEVYTPAEMASLMGVVPMPTESTTEGASTTTEVATTEDGSVDIEQMSAEDAAKVLVERAGTIEEAIAQVKQVIEAVTEERKKMAKAEKKTSLNDIGKKSAELQALDTRLEFYGEVLSVLEGMLAEQQKQAMAEAQNIAEEAGVASNTTEEKPMESERKPVEIPSSGLIRNGTEMKFTDNVIKMVDFIAKRLGIVVEFVDGLKNEAGQPINGDITGKHVRISTSGSRGVKFIMGHEFFHRMKDLVGEQTYVDFVNSIKAYAGEKVWNATMARQRNTYRNHNARVAKDAMKDMGIDEVVKIAELLNINIEGMTLEDAKTAVATGAAMGKEQGVAAVETIFPTMLSYSDELMVEECAADVAGTLVTNTNRFAKYVEDNSSNNALVRGLRKAIRAMSEFFDSFGYTDQQRKLNALDKMLERTLNEAVKNEQKGGKKAREEAKKNGVQGSEARNSLIGEVGAEALDKAEEATTRLDNLAVAREMETSGKDAKAIRLATGWERGADGLWRYELMDAEVNLYDGNESAIRKQIEVAEEEEKDFMQQSKADTKELRERTNSYLAEMREKYGVAEGEETDAMTEEEIAHLQSLTGKEVAFEDYKERRRNELYNRRMALEAQLAYVIVKNTDAPAMILTSRLGHVLKGEYAEQLFKAYPSLKDMEFRFVTDIQQRAFAAYAIDGGKAYIELNVKKTPVNMVAPYLMHEVQHAIQAIEGFAEGGSPAFLNKKLSDRLNAVTKELEKLRAEGKTEEADALVRLNKGLAEAVINNDTDDYGNYQKLMGEVEARNVSARINMTPEERRATLLSETEDVAREDQIFLREGAEMAMAQPKVSLSEEQISSIIEAMKANAEVAPQLELTPENWVAEFGEAGKVITPIGEVKMSEGQYQKMQQQGRKTKLGMVKPTLTNPDVIIEEDSKPKDGKVAERNSSFVFVKAFTNAEGTRDYMFTSVSNRRDGIEIVMSNQEKETPRVKRLLKEGKLAYINKATLPSELTDSAQGDQLTIPSEVSYSKSKDTTSNAEIQTNEQKFSLITPEIDASYMDAVNRGDMETAQKMVMEAAEKTGYINDESWRMNHRAPRKDEENANPFNTEKIVPEDFWEHPEWYTNIHHSGERESFYAMKRAIDKYKRLMAEGKTEEAENVTITMYRGVDKTANKREASFRNGDWITPSRSYAFLSAPYGKARVISQEVKLKDIWWDGNSINEWGYDDGANYGYRDTKNNRKLLDPVTYDDNGNIIPLSERFNPRKEDIRYSISSEEDARFERKVAFLTDLVREYNIPLPTFIAQTKEEFKRMAVEYGAPEEEIDENIDRGYYCGEDDIIFVNAELHRNQGKMHETMLHEHGHHINKLYLSNKIKELANSLNIEDIEVVRKEIFGDGYADKDVYGIINELVCFMVGHLQIEKTKPTFEGQIPTQEFIEAWKKDIESNARENTTKSILYEILPLVKENLEYQKEQYGAEKENTIVIARKEYVQADGGGYKEAELQSNHKRRPFKAQSRNATLDRRGEGADAQEVTRYMLPDPDPSDVFYDEIPIFDEQGNEVDITTLSSEEAKAILDSKVRQMLEAEYEHNISVIRKEAREARQAIIDRYNEEKNKRKKNNKPSRTNAARIDDILGEKPFESLPYEDQALILIATGQVKIRWSDKGTQRGLASELGLTGSKGDKHAYRNIWSGATKSFNEVVHDWWESIGGQERGIDDQDLRNALISALQGVTNSRDAMGEIMRKYDDLSAERDSNLSEVDRIEDKELREAKAAYEQHLANFELAEGEERTAYHDRAAQFFANQSLSRVDDILADLTNELERSKRKIERLKAEKKDVYAPLAENIKKSKDIVLRALERLRMFAGMEEVDLNDVVRLINLVKTARSQRQVENLGAQATALVQRISIKKAKTNLGRLLSLKLSNTDIIHKMLAESETWTKDEREAILKHLWKVSRNGLRVSKAVHRDTKEIFDELKRLVEEFRKEKLKGLNNEQKASAIETKLKAIEAELHPEVVYDKEGNVQDNSNLPTDFNAENKHLAKYLFKTYLEMLAAESAYRNASKVLREKIDNGEKTGEAQAEVAVTREDYLHALTQLNNTLEHLILKGKDELRDWNAQKEKHEIEIRKMGIEAIGGEKAQRQGKRSKWGARQRARWNTTVNAPYWTFETVLEKIDHNSPYKKGVFYNYFMDKWSDANDDLITRYMAHFEELGEAMSKCFPNDATFMKMERNPYRMYQYIMRKAESTPIGTITYKEGDSDRQMVLNIANAMYIIAMWRQPRYQEAMVENGITQQDIDTLMQNIATKDAGFIDFMNWVNEKFLPSTRLEYDVVFRKMNGGSMPKEVNYFPARVAAHQEVDLANIENGAMPTTPTALKDRTSHNIMPEMGMDYFKVLEAHIEDMDKWAAYAELTADLNVLLSSDEFRRRLNEYMGGLGGDGGGKGSLYELFKQTSLIATGLYRGDAGMQAFLGKLQKAWATSNIAFRGWTALKQISSVTTGMFDNLRFYKHALKAATIVGIYSEIKDAMEVSPSLRQRWKSGAAGMEALAREAQRADGYTVQRGAYEKSMDAIGDAIKLLVRAGMTPNAAVDLLSCSIIVNSVYETEIARLTGGKREATEDEKRAAVRKAERAFNTTQQSSEGAYLAPVQANPAFGVLTTYMNASFALHRKRMAGVKELWKLMTSKEYRRFIKDEYGADAAKMSAVDAMKDIMSGIAGELSFAAMGWGLMEFMSWVNSWFNDDDDDDDTAAAKAEFADIWWQSFLNGYLGGSLATSIMQGFDTSLTPAYDEFISDIKGIFDDKGDAVSEVAQVVAKYGLGVDLKALYKIGVGVKNLFKDEERTGAILMLINAPERYVKAFVGDRREGETMEEYQTRIVRFYTLFDDVKYDEYFDKQGKYIGEDAPSIIMSKTKAQALRKEYEAAYRKDVLYHYGGEEAYASYLDTEKKYKDICELLGWKAETEPSKEKRRLSDMHKELAYEQKQVAKKAEKRKNWVGSEEDYYDKLVDEQKAKDELINQYYEYIKQSGLGAY